MLFFNWDAKYSVGIREIDAQHKQLVDILNELYDAMQKQQSNQILGQIITKLITYTKTHFAAEERYMKLYNYPEYNAHIQEHISLTDKVIAFKNDFEAGKVAVSISMANFLKDWLMKHILGTDKKYTSFFNSKGLS